MSKVSVRSYLSPTLVLLAMDWKDGFKQEDFLGFAIKRTPGFRPKSNLPRAKSSWLPNRIGFNGANPNGADMPSNQNPIQHFQWWDARIDTKDRGTTFTYEVYPVTGTPDNLNVDSDNMRSIDCVIPHEVEQGIGTYFNRAVVSSQAFSREFGNIKTTADYVRALSWLSNGMDVAITNFISGASGKGLAGAAYHLTDNQWVIPALKAFNGPVKFDYFFKAASGTTGKGGDNSNAKTIATLKANKNIEFFIRTKTSIMHDKFIVRTTNDDDLKGEVLLTGTANFTTEGLTQQANVIHTFESPELAQLYLERQQLLSKDPTVANTAKGAAWSDEIQVGDASVRVFFAPEPNKSRNSIDAVVKAVQNAKSSVFFSLFSVTDKELLDACLSVAENGKLMRGLVNEIKEPKANAPENASTVAATWLYERSKDDNMVVGHADFSSTSTPNGFWSETNVLKDPSAKPTKGKTQSYVPTVFVHQKIVIIDGESDNPIIYVGSANLSGNSTWHNDENLLEITKSTRLGETYLAEFLRLYEQYRARFSWNKSHSTNESKAGFNLTKDSSWAAKDYKPGTMEFLARTTLGD